MSATLEYTQPDTITAETLAQFIGTTRYYRYTTGLILTDGAAYLAKNGAAWLLDIVASARLVPAVRRAEFECWTLRVDLTKHCAEVVCTDGNGEREANILYRQRLEHTDFPLAELRLYVVADSDPGKVVMLTSEY
ncbi:MAG: DUF6876 family protein [Acetobacter malorum]|uniref:DUF6876 family protein n=1 Tax=Acetobacter malorum TaxID=178901 RepID=UPI0039EB58D1